MNKSVSYLIYKEDMELLLKNRAKNISVHTALFMFSDTENTEKRLRLKFLVS